MPSVFVAGASGAVGRVLVPDLVAAGHEVTAMTRSPDKAPALEAAGATPVVCDVFDRAALERAVAQARPEVVVNQLTDLPRSGLKPRKLGEHYARNDRVRREGAENLVAAALAAGARRYVGQSIAFWYQPTDPPVKDEEAPLWHDAPDPFGPAVAALAQSEDVALQAAGIEAVILRYGIFYGPGTWYAPDGDVGRQFARRLFPVIGDGEGYTSFIHVDDAAAACTAFVERGAPGVYNVVDDEPATANEWMPAFAEAMGAEPPRRVPVLAARVVAGSGMVEFATRARGASNAKVKRELGWEPRHPSWRQGFAEGLS